MPAMGGSRKGKRKNKGKSKPNKSETAEQKSEALNPKLDLGQALSSNPNGPSNIEDESPQTDTNFNSAAKTPMNLEVNFERFLYIKLNQSYNTALERLLTLGYSEPDVEIAILNAGYVHGYTDLVNKVIHNVIGFIEEVFNPTTEPFGDMDELCKTMLEEMVNYVMQTRPDMQRSEAVWHLLVMRWDLISSANTTCSHCETEDACIFENLFSEKTQSSLKNDSWFKKMGSSKPIDHFGDTEDDLKMLVIPSTSGEKSEASRILSRSVLEECSDGLKTRMIADLVTQIRGLQEELKCRTMWAQQKVIDWAKKLTATALELQELRMFEGEGVKGKSKDEKTHLMTFMVKLREKEKSLEQANREASIAENAVKKMELENSKIRSEIDGFKLNNLESKKELKKVAKREKRRLKRLVELERQTNVLRLECDEEKQRALQLKEELAKVEKQAEDAEEKWKQEVKSKEHILALVAQETKNLEDQKASSTAHLEKLQQQLKSDIQQAQKKCLALEDELSRLRESLPVEDLLPENLDFLYCYDKASSSGSRETKMVDHWTCMICMVNEGFLWAFFGGSQGWGANPWVFVRVEN
ncbi:RING/U-box superfamily protein [Striga hermonthica]|uniref:RING/U-box superfamily protein n=1 Tax=Striga hermonthica TaxID=68872 RepID=A0A9N7NCJ0_STRHE|nr:RING/U-box superfamily protein [Striga hermonthica]